MIFLCCHLTFKHTLCSWIWSPRTGKACVYMLSQWRSVTMETPALKEKHRPHDSKKIFQQLNPVTCNNTWTADIPFCSSLRRNLSMAMSVAILSSSPTQISCLPLALVELPWLLCVLPTLEGRGESLAAGCIIEAGHCSHYQCNQPVERKPADLQYRAKVYSPHYTPQIQVHLI